MIPGAIPLSAAAIRELRLAAQGPRPLLSEKQFQKLVGAPLDSAPVRLVARDGLSEEERAEAEAILERWKAQYGIKDEEAQS